MSRCTLFLTLLLFIHSTLLASSPGEEIQTPPVLPREGVFYDEHGQLSVVYVHNQDFLRIQGHNLNGKMRLFARKHCEAKMLYIDNCGPLTADDLDMLLLFPKLEYIKLYNVGLDDELLISLLEALPANLVSIDLGECSLTDIGIFTLCNAACTQNLQKLSLRNKKTDIMWTHKSLLLISLAPMAKSLRQVAMIFPQIDERCLGNFTVNFFYEVLCPYKEFYLDAKELYLLDDPFRWSLLWDVVEGRWDLIYVSDDEPHKPHKIHVNHALEGHGADDQLEFLRNVVFGLEEAAANGEVVIESEDSEDDEHNVLIL